MKNEMNPVVADHERMSAEAAKAYKMNFAEEFHRSARTFRILADSLARHAEGFEDATMEAARCIGEQPSGTGQPLEEVSARIARARTEAYAVLSALDDLVRHKEFLVPHGRLEHMNAVFSESHRIRAEAKNDSRS